MGPGFRLVLALVAFVALVAVATMSYALIEDMGFLDALYMTVITATTTGFREVKKLDAQGQVLTIVVNLGGVFLMAIVLGSLTEVLVAGTIRRIMGRKRMEKQIDSLRDHYVICGNGRIGHIVADDLAGHGVPYVIIEKDVSTLGSSEDGKLFFVEGDATEDDVLNRAGISRARGLIAALPSNAQNAFVVMSARELAPHLLIIARADEEGAEKKLLRAGADRVVSPYEIGGRRMAQCILRPSVMDFIELVTVSPEEGQMQLSEVRVRSGSDLIDKTLIEAEIRDRHAVYVIALKNGDSKMDMNPAPHTRIKEGDVLILIGPSDGLEGLEKRARSSAPTGSTG
jgi:voltage-gated potassium channel